MKVLLTGGSGFVASHCLGLLLQDGHEIVTTVRSKAKGQRILDCFSSAYDKLSFVVVEDIAKRGAFDNAVQVRPFDAVIHVASPFHYKPQDVQKDLIDPAVIGTLNILTAIKSFGPTVQRLVITSSFSAVVNVKCHPKRYEENDFNPMTLEEAYEDGMQAYRASKTFAERAAWDFIRENEVHFSMATINPPLILGPPAPWLGSEQAINTSNERLRDLLQGKWKHSLPPTASWYWVDVRDVALAHVRAMQIPEAGGRRFFVMQGKMSNADIANIAVDKFPHLRDQVPEVLTDDTPPDHWDVDTAPSREILDIEYRGLEECILDSLDALRAIN